MPPSFTTTYSLRYLVTEAYTTINPSDSRKYPQWCQKYPFDTIVDTDQEKAAVRSTAKVLLNMCFPKHLYRKNRLFS